MWFLALSRMGMCFIFLFFFFFNDPATTEIYTLSLHDALPISPTSSACRSRGCASSCRTSAARSEEHTSELPSHSALVCRLLLEKKKPQTLAPQHLCAHIKPLANTTIENTT